MDMADTDRHDGDVGDGLGRNATRVNVFIFPSAARCEKSCGCRRGRALTDQRAAHPCDQHGTVLGGVAARQFQRRKAFAAVAARRERAAAEHPVFRRGVFAVFAPFKCAGQHGLRRVGPRECGEQPFVRGRHGRGRGWRRVAARRRAYLAQRPAVFRGRAEWKRWARRPEAEAGHAAASM